MPLSPGMRVGVLFILIAAIFWTLVIRDTRRPGAKSAAARQIWFRLGLIFATVGAVLVAMNR